MNPHLQHEIRTTLSHVVRTTEDYLNKTSSYNKLMWPVIIKVS